MKKLVVISICAAVAICSGIRGPAYARADLATLMQNCDKIDAEAKANLNPGRQEQMERETTAVLCAKTRETAKAVANHEVFIGMLVS
jgi:hypothetical protein